MQKFRIKYHKFLSFECLNSSCVANSLTFDCVWHADVVIKQAKERKQTDESEANRQKSIQSINKSANESNERTRTFNSNQTNEHKAQRRKRKDKRKAWKHKQSVTNIIMGMGLLNELNESKANRSERKDERLWTNWRKLVSEHESTKQIERKITSNHERLKQMNHWVERKLANERATMNMKVLTNSKANERARLIPRMLEQEQERVLGCVGRFKRKRRMNRRSHMGMKVLVCTDWRASAWKWLKNEQSQKRRRLSTNKHKHRAALT